MGIAPEDRDAVVSRRRGFRVSNQVKPNPLRPRPIEILCGDHTKPLLPEWAF